MNMTSKYQLLRLELLSKIGSEINIGIQGAIWSSPFPLEPKVLYALVGSSVIHHYFQRLTDARLRPFHYPAVNHVFIDSRPPQGNFDHIYVSDGQKCEQKQELYTYECKIIHEKYAYDFVYHFITLI